MGKSGKTYAIRHSDRVYNVGDTLNPSHVWEDGVMTDVVLPGTSGILVCYDPVYDDVEPDWETIARKTADYYGYAHAYVMSTEEIPQYGEDRDEIILPDARIERVLW